MTAPPPEDFDASRPPFIWMSWVPWVCYVVSTLSPVAGAYVFYGQPAGSPRWAFGIGLVAQAGVSCVLASACLIAWRERHVEIERWRRRRRVAQLPPGNWRRNSFETEPWQVVVGGVCCFVLGLFWVGMAVSLARSG